MTPSLQDSVSKLHLLKPEHEKALQKLGIKTVHDLLHHFPRDWSDLSEIKPISEIRPGSSATIKAQVVQISDRGSRFRRIKILETLLSDSTGHVVAVWFNQPFVRNILKPGQEYFFHGKVQFYTDKKGVHTMQLQNPTYELPKSETIHMAGIVPEYPSTSKITQKQIRYWESQALLAANQITDPIPKSMRDRLKLVHLNLAIKNIHFPHSQKSLEAARRRLAFDELFIFQLAFQAQKQKIQALPAPQIPFDKQLISEFIKNLPFHLTNSQRLACFEVLQDISKNHPMNRLLEGEVGSGKTVVAGLAMYKTAHAGYQSVLLAPTEILALQHYETLKKLFAHADIEIALLTRSQKIIRHPTSDIRHLIVIGTHALLQEHVKFDNLGLLIVDEQHRFGIKQRAKLLTEDQALVPHLLSMSATPIPRTLALAFYGDLDISRLTELPTGRKKIITKLVRPDGRDIAYRFIKQELKKGYQAYVIVPLVGEEAPANIVRKTIVAESEKLRQVFSEFRIGVLHGRMKGAEKKQIMHDFKVKKINLLVATTVIEVGVDIPNATIIIIENAEMFGLAQLHQLRGRVGRSSLQSYCLLFTDSVNPDTRERLEAVVKSNDGFELSEIDLKLRGPGEVIGTRQSGFIPFKIAKLSDTKLINLAKTEAKQLLDQDPKLENFPELRPQVEALAKSAHLE